MIRLGTTDFKSDLGAYLGDLFSQTVIVSALRINCMSSS